jgi:hypothetical protein
MRDWGRDERWVAVRTALLEQTRVKMNHALEAPPGARDDAIGYARALRDLVVAFESATTGMPVQRVEKPGPLGGTPNATR